MVMPFRALRLVVSLSPCFANRIDFVYAQLFPCYGRGIIAADRHRGAAPCRHGLFLRETNHFRYAVDFAASRRRISLLADDTNPPVFAGGIAPKTRENIRRLLGGMYG